ncbi:MAG: SH3 domain-containing protein [Clostridium sp.]|nr:SH3 domain-containing protein [Clostridium sp.]
MKRQIKLLIASTFLLVALCNYSIKAKTYNDKVEKSNYKINYASVVKPGNLKDIQGNLIGNIKKGDMVIITKESDTKSAVIEKKTGLSGYIDNSYLKNINDGNINNIQHFNEIGTIQNVDTLVNLREAPSINSLPLDGLENNTSVTILGKVDNWFKVQVGSTKGYIFEEYVAS